MIPASATSGEVAQVLGVTERAVGVRRQDGRLPLTSDGRIDLHAVVRAGVEALGKPRPAEALDLEREKARLAREQADQVAMKNAHMRGELVELAPIRAAILGTIEVVKTHLFRLPAKLFPDDVRERQRATDLITKALTDLSAERAIEGGQDHDAKRG